jgi:hypothetical protein
LANNATDLQQQYLIDLFLDNNFTLLERRAWLKSRFEVEHVDELAKSQASEAIQELREQKERSWNNV